MALFYFTKALLVTLKNAPADERFWELARHSTSIICPFIIAYTVGLRTGSERQVTRHELVCSPPGYPRWKESAVRKELVELIGFAA